MPRKIQQIVVTDEVPDVNEFGVVVRPIGGGGGGPATIADGADVNSGSTTDPAETSDSDGTLSGKLRGLVKWAYERMPASLGQKTSALSFPVVLPSDAVFFNQRVGTTVALNAAFTFAEIDVDGYLGASFIIDAGTLDATILLQASWNGTDYIQNLYGVSTLGGPIEIRQGIILTNPNPQFRYSPIIPAGVKKIRLVVASYTSGSANVTGYASNAIDSDVMESLANAEGVTTDTRSIPIGGLGSTNEHRPLRFTNFNPSVTAYAPSVRPIPRLSSTVVHTSIPDSASSVMLLALNTSRLGASLFNTSSAPLLAKLGTTASLTDFTVRIVKNGYWEVPFDYVGRIDGIWETDPNDGAAKVAEF